MNLQSRGPGHPSRMLAVRLCCSLLFIPWIAACVTGFPPPPPLGEADSGIVIAISLSPPVSLFGAFDRSPEVVYFVRDEGQEQFSLENVIVSRYRKDGRFYALGIEPGVYLPIACSYTVQASMNSVNDRTAKLGFALPDTTSYTTFFSRSMAESARARVSPGELFIMGRYEVDMSLNFSSADQFQKANHALIAPGIEEFSAASYLKGAYIYTGTPRDSPLLPADREELLKRVAQDLAGTEWTRLNAHDTQH